MIKIVNGQKVDVSRLDARKLFEHGLVSNGWHTLHYIFNSEPRRFERNTQTVEDLLWIFFLFIAIPFSLLFYHYWPFKIMGLMLVGGILLGALMGGVTACNKGWSTGSVYCLAGAAALYFHINVGLDIFGWHFDKYYYIGFMAVGALTLLRRAWNAFAWYVQDKAVLRLYIDNKLSLHQEPLAIDDYRKAFTDTHKAYARLAQALAGPNETICEIDILLSNGTRDGLTQALMLLKRETENVKR